MSLHFAKVVGMQTLLCDTVHVTLMEEKCESGRLLFSETLGPYLSSTPSAKLKGTVP